MSWLARVRQRSQDRSDSKSEEPSDAAPVERASPGLAALFEGLCEDGRHSILDLGCAGNRHLRVLGGFARQIRFAGLTPEVPRGEALRSALEALPDSASRPYDVILAWDVFDRLDEAERRAMIDRILGLTAPGARLYTVVASSQAAMRAPVRSTLVDLSHVSQVTVGPPEPARPPLLPGQVERLLTPFEIVHAFSLRIGLREYVAVRR